MNSKALSFEKLTKLKHHYLITSNTSTSDESGCEADMAEGGTEEESGDMLGPAIAPAHQPPAINMKAE
ncbi:hypothetical protein RN001_011860, partial [Aquatica leii]